MKTETSTNMIDEQKLRELAEAATPGPWHWDSDPIKGDPLDRVRFRVVATGRTITQCYYSSSDDMAQKEAEWIATANPAAILAMLDELQSLRSERTARRVSAENAEAAVKQARIDALEEARDAVSAEEILEAEDNADDAYNCGVYDCVRAVESLKGKTP